MSRFLFLLLSGFLFCCCFSKRTESAVNDSIAAVDSVDTIELAKAFLYDDHTLPDTYKYNDTEREFQWVKIREYLHVVDSIQKTEPDWAVIHNRKDEEGKAPRAKKMNEGKKEITDTFGVEQYQSVPLYNVADLSVPERYGKDGALVKILEDSADYYKVEVIYINSTWFVPKKYVNILDSVVFEKAIFVDRSNQNIATLEKENDNKWLIRSMNPATTGVNKPPFKRHTPRGIFVVQDKTPRMNYYKDGTRQPGGFAPHASRFCGGAYIHGIPIDLPKTAMVEISGTLGTVPKSHMCVRNATSHAKYIYKWADTGRTLVIVFD